MLIICFPGASQDLIFWSQGGFQKCAHLMSKENLTDQRIRSFTCPDGKLESFLWDLKVPGLGLRIRQSGARTFIFQTRLDGANVRITIGSPETWDKLDEVRKEARRLSALIDQGVDPRAEKRRLIKSQQEERIKLASRHVTVAEAWSSYLEYQNGKMQLANLERGKKWGARHFLDHQRMAQAGGESKARGSGKTKAGVLVPLLPLKLNEVTPEVLVRWVTKESESRATKARQAFEAFRAFWRWCSTRSEYKTMIDLDAIEDKEMRDHVPSRKAKAGHDDVLEAQQLSEWFAAVRDLDNPVIAAYLQGLLITGARREELATLKWSDVEWRWGAIFLHDKVDGTGQRKIPLTPYLRSIITSLPRRNEWVFSSVSSASGRITEPRIPHNRALSKAGLPHLTLHGLRRSFITLSEWVEMPQGVVSQIAGHKPSATAERHYKRRPLDLLALWHGKYEAWMLEKAGITYELSSSVTKLIRA